jgi:hypothetical protein
VPSAKTLSPSLKNKPVFAEYRLEIIGVNRPKPAAPKPVVPVVVAPAPIVLAVKPTTPVQTKSGKPTFTELPPANPNFPFHAATSVVQTKPAPESVASEMPAPLAALPAVAETKPKKKTAPTKVAKESVAKPKLIVNADNGLGGRVASADEAGRFVVLNFPLGQMPRVDSTMTLYRHGVKSATIKITGPQRDDNIAADVLSGSPAEGDAAREE